MKNILLALSALIFALTGLVFTFQQEVEENNVKVALGGFESSIQKVGSTTGQATYFHEATGVRTATTTLLTIDRASQVEKYGLNVTVKNATNTVNTIYIIPESSFDALEWHTLSGFGVANQPSGSNLQSLDIGNGSSTQLTYTPISLGTTSVQYWFDPPVDNFMRFRVWTNGTSSVHLEAIKLFK